MNRIFFLTLSLLALAACRKSNGILFSDVNRLELKDTTSASSSFFYKDASVTRDTVYVEVNTTGYLSGTDRPVSFIQNTENDTPYAAIPGKHYIPFDDVSVKPFMVIKANKATALIPVILLRNSSLKDTSFRLRIDLAPNESFSNGSVRKRSKVLIFSDRLERFYSWRVDNAAAPAFTTFGKYSRGKHQFMYEMLKTPIDEAWYQAVNNIGATTSYKNLLKKYLNAYNSDPDNIISGKAPVRETSDPSSPIITFP